MLGETDENWMHCIERTLELEPDSVTIYQMEVPGNTTLFKDLQAGKMEAGAIASWEQKRAWVDQAFTALGEASPSAVNAWSTQARFCSHDAMAPASILPA